MKKKHARDIPDFSRSAPPTAKHGTPQPSRELSPARQRQPRQVVKPNVVAKPGRRGQ